MVKVELVTSNCRLGEGPHWDAATQSLYFVDILGKSILKYTPSTKTTTKSTLEQTANFIIPLEGKPNQFVISQANKLVAVSWDGSNDSAKIIEELSSVPFSQESPMTFNDAKCDSTGRLWTGAHIIDSSEFSKTEPLGTLYSLDASKQLKGHLDKIRVSNGIAFNDKTQKMFFIDSLTGTIDRFDFDITKGTISNRQPWFTLRKCSIPGVADGMTIDSDGNLWVAIFGANRVLKLDGNKVESLLDTLEIPAQQVTSATFGGPNFDELYVTTAGIEYGGYKPTAGVDGATYKVTGLGVKGLPGVNFKLN